MSLEHYMAIHELLDGLPRWPAGTIPPPRPTSRRLPKTPGYNGIYFMYESGETFQYNGRTFDRIVRVGINEQPGRLYRRLRDYGHDGGTILHGHVQRALAARAGVEVAEIADWQVTTHITANFEYTKVTLRSAEDARRWEKRLIPTIAEYSCQFATPGWLGRHTRLPYCIWNIEYASWPSFDEEDVHSFRALIQALKAEPPAQESS